jgi:hypothetical protein
MGTGKSSQRLVVFDDSAYPKPGVRTFVSANYTDTAGVRQVPCPLAAGIWWVGIHNVGTAVTSARASGAQNPWQPGAATALSTATAAQGGYNLAGQGTTTPNPWPVGSAITDAAAVSFLAQAT